VQAAWHPQPANETVEDVAGGFAFRASVEASEACARLFEKPTPQRRQQALEGVARATGRIDTALEAEDIDDAERAALKRGRVALHLLRTLLLDDETFATVSAIENPVATAPAAPGASNAA